MTIGTRIKARRKALNMSADELAARLGKDRSTIYRYEKGDIENLPLDILKPIAEVLETTPAALMGWVDEVTAETNDAIADITIAMHRKPALVPKVKAYIKANCPEMQAKLAATAEKLNDAGMEELVDYGEYLGSKEEYRLADGEKRSFYHTGDANAAPAGELVFIRHYLTPAAAGYAAPIEGEDFELIPVTDDVPARADFCIDISGDSMAPYIEDGQRVYVQRDATLEPFDVGVFFVDGDVLCKQYTVDSFGTLYLLSANKKREDANRVITRDSSSTVVCFGKVILPRKLPKPIY